ncbi:MAG: LAGLIDADG family homing endonuclease [Candidatus Bathyarchaeia archaeon]
MLGAEGGGRLERRPPTAEQIEELARKLYWMEHPEAWGITPEREELSEGNYLVKARDLLMRGEEGRMLAEFERMLHEYKVSVEEVLEPFGLTVVPKKRWEELSTGDVARLQEELETLRAREKELQRKLWEKTISEKEYRERMEKEIAELRAKLAEIGEVKPPAAPPPPAPKELSREEISKLEDLFRATLFRELGRVPPNAMAECVKSHTIIPGDYKSIMSLREGDTVVGLSGKNKVRGTFKRPYAGPMILVKAAGLMPVELTPEHPVLVCQSKTRRSKVYFEEVTWKQASLLKEKHTHEDGDYVIMPKPPKFIKVTEIDLRKYIKRQGIKTAIGKGVPIKFPINEETAWLLGLYIAEGCYDNRRHTVIITLGKHEISLAKKALKIITKLGYKAQIKKRQAVIQVKFYSHILGRALEKWCGKYAHHKRIPDFILFHSNDNVVKSFLDGYIQGDGYYYEGKGRSPPRFSVTTSSKILILQLQLLLSRFNIFMAIHKVKKGTGNIKGIPIKWKEKFRGEWCKSTHVKFLNECILVPVRMVKTKYYKGTVRNIETTDGTYLVSNFVVHNCRTELETVKRLSFEEASRVIERLAMEIVGRFKPAVPRAPPAVVPPAVRPPAPVRFETVRDVFEKWLMSEFKMRLEDFAGLSEERKKEVLARWVGHMTGEKGYRPGFTVELPKFVPEISLKARIKALPPGEGFEVWLKLVKHMDLKSYLELSEEKKREILDEWSKWIG